MINLSDLVEKLCNRCQEWEENVTKITIGLILHLTGYEDQILGLDKVLNDQ